MIEVSENLPKLRDILCMQPGAIAGLREAPSVCESPALPDLKIAGHSSYGGANSGSHRHCGKGGV
jgi:hypothetical protein